MKEYADILIGVGILVASCTIGDVLAHLILRAF